MDCNRPLRSIFVGFSFAVVMQLIAPGGSRAEPVMTFAGDVNASGEVVASSDYGDVTLNPDAAKVEISSSNSQQPSIEFSGPSEDKAYLRYQYHPTQNRLYIGGVSESNKSMVLNVHSDEEQSCSIILASGTTGRTDIYHGTGKNFILRNMGVGLRSPSSMLIEGGQITLKPHDAVNGYVNENGYCVGGGSNRPR